MQAWRPAIATLMIVLTASTGCIASFKDDAEALDAASVLDPGAGLLTGLESGLPVEPRVGATLDAPPAWRLGEWWRIDFDAAPYGFDAHVDRVVAGVDGGSYLVGMSADAFHHGVVLLHFPGYGEVSPDTLGFDAHDRSFVPLRFPLAEGATWETQWYTGAPLEAVVTAVEGSTATVEMTGARHIELVYDADIGAVRSFRIEGYGGYEVVDHGYGYEGAVQVPAGQDLVFCHGRAAVATVVDLCETRPPTEPGAPIETVELEGTYDHSSFGLFVRQGGEAPVGGLLGIRVIAPWGEEYATGMLPTDAGMRLEHFGHEDPTGTWEIDVGAVGTGLAILEGVAYNLLDVELGGSSDENA